MTDLQVVRAQLACVVVDELGLFFVFGVACEEEATLPVRHREHE